MQARSAPWGPGPLLTPLGMAAWLRREGVPHGDLNAQLRSRFPSVSPAQIGKVLSQFNRIDPIQSRFDTGYIWNKLSRQDMPRQANIPSAYRFIVDVHFVDRRGGRLTTRTLVIDSHTNLTLGELQGRAEALSRDIFDQPKRAYDRSVNFRNVRRMQTNLILATRRT